MAHSFAQRVTAVSGFAYGVINADIHVFAGGEPLYLLAEWQPPSRADPSWHRQMPSRMLNAGRAVVPFTGRAEELADVRRWRDTGPRLAVEWLHGPGGQGKTRLAAQFAAESVELGWKVVTAFHGPDADAPEPGSHDMTLDGAAGLLLIVDYADRWLLRNLTWLFKNRLLHHAGVATRLLLIGRGLDAWPAICGILDRYSATTSHLRLRDLAVEGDTRWNMFAAARDSFAQIYGRPEAFHAALSADLNSPEFGLTLAVHMAALVAVDAAVRGVDAPESMDALTRYLLNREQLNWARLHQDGVTEEGRSYRTPAYLMNQAVFTAALTGPMDPSAGSALFGRLGIGPEPERILRDHAVCYPPADAVHSNVLEPLYPDRLAEDFLALTMPGHDSDYAAQDWAPALSAAVLTTVEGQGHAARTITYLAAAADRWEHVGAAHLFPLLREQPHLAVAAGGPALQAVASIGRVDLRTLVAIESLLPETANVDLDVAAASITTRLTRYLLARNDDPEICAGLYFDHAIRLARAGRLHEAQEASEQATALYRRLAAVDAEEHLDDLVTSLTNLSTLLSALGRRGEALTAATEAVDIARTLPDRDLSKVLNNLGNALSGLGRYQEALRAAEESLAIRRTADDAPELASSLMNHSIRLADMGRHADALGPAQEAVNLYRQMPSPEADLHRPDLAAALNALANALSEVGRRNEALDVSIEAVTLYRLLAKVNPDVHRPSLAGACNNLGNRLADLGLFEDALTSAAEATDLYRQLSADDPATYLPELAMALQNINGNFAELGQHEAALSSAEEAVTLYRELAKAYPDAHSDGLAGAVNHMSLRLLSVDQTESAVAHAGEGTDILRRLSEMNPVAYHPRLVLSLNNLGLVLGAAGRSEEALAAVEDAVDLAQHLAAEAPEIHWPALARSLHNRGACLLDLGRWDAARSPFAEAIRLYRQSPTALPQPVQAAFAQALHGFARASLRARVDLENVLETLSEAADILMPLVEEAPETYREPFLLLMGSTAELLDEVDLPDRATSLRRRFGLPESATGA